MTKAYYKSKAEKQEIIKRYHDIGMAKLHDDFTDSTGNNGRLTFSNEEKTEPKEPMSIDETVELLVSEILRMNDSVWNRFKERFNALR